LKTNSVTFWTNLACRSSQTNPTFNRHDDDDAATVLEQSEGKSHGVDLTTVDIPSFRYPQHPPQEIIMPRWTSRRKMSKWKWRKSDDDDEGAAAMDIGLPFLEATTGPQPPRAEHVEQALTLIDAVLTLTTAIVSTPTG
jgi:hypothetical protein